VESKQREYNNFIKRIGTYGSNGEVLENTMISESESKKNSEMKSALPEKSSTDKASHLQGHLISMINAIKINPSFLEQINSFIQNLKIAQRVMAQAIEPAINASRLFSGTMRGLFENKEQLIKIMKALEEDEKAWTKIETSLIASGWFPSGDWTVINTRHLLKLIDAQDYKGIDRYMMNYYSKRRIEGIGEKWLPKLKKNRAKVLKDALFAHGIRKYALSIIVLLSQIEGLIREQVGAQGTCHYGKLLGEYFRSLKDNRNKTLVKDAIAEEIQKKLIKRLFLNHGANKRSGKIAFTRHTALHGINVKDFNKTNSIKLILLTDYLIFHDILI